MDTNANKAVYQRFIDELFNAGNLDLLDELVAPDYVLHDAPPGFPQGPEAIRQTVQAFRTGFPDLQITLEELVAEGDKVSSRATMRGTHTGVLFGIPPTAKQVAVPGLTMVTVQDGRVKESWVKNDVTVMFAQLGVKPPGG